jgi:proton-translocating NADH-quinone oxidoreductase chain M
MLNSLFGYLVQTYEQWSSQVYLVAFNFIIWWPLLGLMLLFLLKIFDSIIEQRWLIFENYSGVSVERRRFAYLKNLSRYLLYRYRFIIILISFINLFFALLLYKFAITYSAYGLHYFQQLKSFYFFGSIKNFVLIFDEFISFFILLNAFVIFCCLIFVCLNKTYILSADVIRRSQLLLLTQFFANLAFMSSDMLGFYIFYEAILIPVFFLIGIWGSSQRRIKAAYFFFFFTLVSSMPMLIGILILRKFLYSTNYFVIFNYGSLLDPFLQKVVWFLFFISFAFKIPMFPAHIWLPEAHVEAPTEGSMVLAGLLLKLGFFGFFRFLLQLFPDTRDFFFDFVTILALLSVISASLTALRQTDLKRIIAYSSIAHMNFALLGFCTLTQVGIVGAFITMFGHAIVSTILFSLIGSLYARTGTRLLNYYSGLVVVMPFFCIFFVFFSFFNAALPGSLSFIGEFFTFLSLVEYSLVLLILTLFSFVLNIVYMLWLVNRLCFGDLNTNFIKIYNDLTQVEIDFYFAQLILSFGFGLMPNVLIDVLVNHIYLISM